MTVKMIAGAVFGFVALLVNFRLLLLIIDRARTRAPKQATFYMAKWYGIRFMLFLAVTLSLAYLLGWDFGLGALAGLGAGKVLLLVGAFFQSRKH